MTFLMPRFLNIFNRQNFLIFVASALRFLQVRICPHGFNAGADQWHPVAAHRFSDKFAAPVGLVEFVNADAIALQQIPQLLGRHAEQGRLIPLLQNLRQQPRQRRLITAAFLKLAGIVRLLQRVGQLIHHLQQHFHFHVAPVVGRLAVVYRQHPPDGLIGNQGNGEAGFDLQLAQQLPLVWGEAGLLHIGNGNHQLFGVVH